MFRAKKKTKLSREPIDRFVEDFKEAGIDIEVRDQKEIIKKCGKAFLNLWKSSLVRAKPTRIVCIFREKEKRTSWYSEYLDRTIANMAHPPNEQELQKAAIEAKEIQAIEAEFKKSKK